MVASFVQRMYAQRPVYAGSAHAGVGLEDIMAFMDCGRSAAAYCEAKGSGTSPKKTEIGSVTVSS